MLPRANAIYTKGVVQERDSSVTHLLHFVRMDWICTLIPMLTLCNDQAGMPLPHVATNVDLLQHPK